MKKRFLMGMVLPLMMLLAFSTFSGNKKDSPTVEWIAAYNGPENGVDKASAMAVDPAGNVYVTGYTGSDRATNRENFVTIKYNKYGSQIWAEIYDGPGNKNDRAIDLAVDRMGNVYVTGYSHVIKAGFVFATIKYDRYGNQVWVERHNFSGQNPSSEDVPTALSLDPQGNVYVTGYCDSTWKSTDYITIKYKQ